MQLSRGGNRARVTGDQAHRAAGEGFGVPDEDTEQET
jgi:hypothetical protein